jgi:uncharacterized membrane protein
MTTRIIAVAAVLVLPLWFVRIETAFGLPAHPLLLHVPVVFVPILGLAALAVALNTRLLDRIGVPLAAFSVVTLASTLLAAGAGEVFKENQEPRLSQERLDTLEQHAEAGDFLRWLVILLTFALVAALIRMRMPNSGQLVLRGLIVLLAVTSVFWVIRTGHLGSKAVWSDAQVTDQIT